MYHFKNDINEKISKILNKNRINKKILFTPQYPEQPIEKTYKRIELDPELLLELDYIINPSHRKYGNIIDLRPKILEKFGSKIACFFGYIWGYYELYHGNEYTGHSIFENNEYHTDIKSFSLCDNEISKNTGESIETIQQLKQKLIELKWIKVKNKKNSNRTYYEVLMDNIEW